MQVSRPALGEKSFEAHFPKLDREMHDFYEVVGWEAIMAS